MVRSTVPIPSLVLSFFKDGRNFNLFPYYRWLISYSTPYSSHVFYNTSFYFVSYLILSLVIPTLEFIFPVFSAATLDLLNPFVQCVYRPPSHKVQISSSRLRDPTHTNFISLPLPLHSFCTIFFITPRDSLF